ncbi:MAG TPA: B12-binding domain-containing radical SAM protein [Acidobacteriaceae bacterium]|nr:B12-binding domain-containing radical SAM protein [Acidobacteriaceae bacterium]
MPSLPDPRLHVLPNTPPSIPSPELISAPEPALPDTKSFAPLGPNVKVLMVWPSFPPSFWGFEGVLEMIPERAMTPPLGLITVAALCPATWQIRLIDHAFEELRDEDLKWADLVMVSAMHAQRADALNVLGRARAFNKRTFVGGPWSSTDPEAALAVSDHVMVGEAEEAFPGIAAALENGTAHALYRIIDKPDMTRSPVPRFDLLHREKYTSMPIQFSRGCPFQCEFCDIITIYGRRPRAKTPTQVIRELDVLRDLGWRNEVFIVDDNFIGNHAQALALTRELIEWQKLHQQPFSFYTEASIDLASREELMNAMVAANFMYVFIGIETPSAEALKESHKFQNLRKNNVDQVRIIQEKGLWVLAGFIVGFDSDDETIFARQLEFINRTAIAWAMAGILMAPPTTALFDRMKREGRLIEDSQSIMQFGLPNFRTVLPLPILLRGLATLLEGLYQPDAFFERAYNSLKVWQPQATQKPPYLGMSYNLRVLFSSMWRQGIRSGYRLSYWRFLCRMVNLCRHSPAKIWLGFTVLLSAHHFVLYSKVVIKHLEEEAEVVERSERKPVAAATNAFAGVEAVR